MSDRNGELSFHPWNAQKSFLYCYGFDFADAMQRVQDVIAKIEPHDSAKRYSGLGVDVIQGEARIVSPWEVEVGDRRISARSLILATGARPLVPPIPGLDTIDYLTSETIWNLRRLPQRLPVLGGGPVGCELTQAFARFGSEVAQVEMEPRLLPREDADAAALVTAQLEAEGVRVATAHKALRVQSNGARSRLVCDHDGDEVVLEFDALLLALGRAANIDGYGLKELGVRLSDHSTIGVDALLPPTFPTSSSAAMPPVRSSSRTSPRIRPGTPRSTRCSHLSGRLMPTTG